jgi:hypothetical protein
MPAITRAYPAGGASASAAERPAILGRSRHVTRLHRARVDDCGRNGRIQPQALLLFLVALTRERLAARRVVPASLPGLRSTRRARVLRTPLRDQRRGWGRSAVELLQENSPHDERALAVLELEGRVQLLLKRLLRAWPEARGGPLNLAFTPRLDQARTPHPRATASGQPTRDLVHGSYVILLSKLPARRGPDRAAPRSRWRAIRAAPASMQAEKCSMRARPSSSGEQNSSV